MTLTAPLSLRLPAELRERIARRATNLAAKRGRAKPITNDVCVEALVAGLDVIEAAERADKPAAAVAAGARGNRHARTLRALNDARAPKPRGR